jgi:hypothetical protein
MKANLIIWGMMLALCTAVQAQSMIGLTKEEVSEKVKMEHREFRKDATVVRQQFNYLKYVNGAKTRTWILYFTKDDICKTSKLVCDYSEYDEVIEDLSNSFTKVGDSIWEKNLGGITLEITLTKQEWYFTVREAIKD